MDDIKSVPARRRLATFKVACAYGGFRKDKAYALINSGVIDAYKMGPKTMIDLETIDRYHASLPKVVPRALHTKDGQARS